MSVAVPTQLVIVPAASRMGIARASCQRYVPSARRSRYSVSKIAPAERDSSHRTRIGPRSSGWMIALGSTPASRSRPVNSYQRSFKYVVVPAASVVQTICGSASARER
jgi:hypothetical protein